MTETLAGWTVTNAVPSDVVTGLHAGQYRQSGGVIRWAPDTVHAGQIVRHLLPVSADPTVASGIVNPLLAAAQSTMTLAGGLNLSVGVMGFAFLFHKLSELNAKLDGVASDVKAIKEFLELKEKAELETALKNLADAPEFEEPGNKTYTLLSAKETLSLLKMKYEKLLAKADTLETALGCEQYFFFSSLARATCLAELGEPGMAERQLEKDGQFYKDQVRRVARQFILGDNRERFLFGDYVDLLPANRLAACLDFVEDTHKGLGWIDELRRELAPEGAMALPMALLFGGAGAKVKVDVETGVPALLRFVARDELLTGCVAQYNLLETAQPKGLTPSEFGRQAARLGSRLNTDHLVLAPPSTCAA